MVSAHLLALALMPWAIQFVPGAHAASPPHFLARRQVAAPSHLFPIKRSSDASIYKVVGDAVPYFRAAPLCQQAGMALADVTTTNWKELVQVEGVGVKAWISTWNHDNYGGACLLLSNTGISIADSCDTNLPALCAGKSSTSEKVAKSKTKPKSSKPTGAKSSHNSTSDPHRNSTLSESHSHNLTHPHPHNLTHPHPHNSTIVHHLHHNSTIGHHHNSTTSSELHGHRNGTVSVPKHHDEKHHHEGDSKHHHEGGSKTHHEKESKDHHEKDAKHHHAESKHHHNGTKVEHAHLRNSTASSGSSRKGPHRLDTRAALLRMSSR